MTTPYASESYIHQILAKAKAAKASDVHLKVGQPPGARVGTSMNYFRVEKLKPDDMEAAALVLVGDRAFRDHISTLHEATFSYSAPNIGRFRVSLYRQQGSLAMVMRCIPFDIPSMDELGLPPSVQGFCELGSGLVLVAGPASSGRTTTLASIIARINASAGKHVLTLEDPIEYVFEDVRGSVSQREVGRDVSGIAVGLASAPRVDADVILVSELAGDRNVDLALDAVEMGKLVLASVSAPDVEHAIYRLGRTPERLSRMADCLHAVLAQKLIWNPAGTERVPLFELLIATADVRETLRTSDGIPRLGTLMERGAEAHGMRTFAMHLQELRARGVLSAQPPPQG